MRSGLLDDLIDDRATFAALLVAPPGFHGHGSVQRCRRVLAEDDFARTGLAFGGGKAVEGFAGQRVDQLHPRVADDEAAHRPVSDRDLHREGDRSRIREPDRRETRHCQLHRRRGGYRPPTVVFVEPAGDRIAREADGASTKAIALADQRVVDLVELMDELLGPTLRPIDAHERLGERREAGNVHEQRGAVRPVRQIEATSERQASIRRNEDAGLFHVVL